MAVKKVFLWCAGIDNFIRNTGFVAGVQVQMSFWAKAFAAHGWKVYSFSSNGLDETIQNIHFVSQKQPALFQKLHISFLGEFLSIWRGVFKVRPDVVIIRGALRETYLLSIVCKLKGIKLVFMGASDVNFIKGRDAVGGPKLNTLLYRRSFKRIKYFVTQNQLQSDSLKQYYSKESLIIPNIWVVDSSMQESDKLYDAIWVSNLRLLKRVEWFLNLAEKMPNLKFAIVGGSFKDTGYYDQIKEKADRISNLSFLGKKSFDETTRLISQSRLLVCTSEYEGFPNTFLQAWAMTIPVVSTVDPNDAIVKNGLGITLSSETDLYDAVKELTNDHVEYGQCVDNVRAYFEANHSSESAYDRLYDYLYESLLKG